MNANEARAMWAADRPILEAAGVVFAGAETYRCEDWGYDHRRVPTKYWGYDAQPALTSVPNAGIPSFLTLTVDPEVNEILFARTQFSKILGEVKRGDWTAQTALFPTIEHTGEVSSYNDYSENGVAGLNAYWPQRQSYLFQLIKRYGELELDRAALAKINWASEIDQAAATVMQQFLNYTYGFGVAGLQNYGILNDPALPASVTPGTKTAGNGNVWIFNGTVNATANEVFADIQALFIALVAQTGGILKQDDEVVLALSPSSSLALTATNSFNVNVEKLLKDNFPKIEIITEVRYGARTALNPQGLAAGSAAQMVAKKLAGKQTGFSAFNEKMRQGTVVRQLSSFAQKVTGGSWGTVIRQPSAIATMVGL
jgi:hypothetical protein